jgi:hypothetical protein
MSRIVVLCKCLMENHTTPWWIIYKVVDDQIQPQNISTIWLAVLIYNMESANSNRVLEIRYYVICVIFLYPYMEVYAGNLINKPLSYYLIYSSLQSPWPFHSTLYELKLPTSKTLLKSPRTKQLNRIYSCYPVKRTGQVALHFHLSFL